VTFALDLRLRGAARASGGGACRPRFRQRPCAADQPADHAAERVRGGDLSTRVEEGTADDELATLTRAFNRMTSQLGAQRGELMEAYRQIDERRRFTETVLSGVSAGVVGLDAEGRINLPNRSASELLGIDLDAGIGLPLARVVPEFAPLIAEAAAAPERPRMAEIPIGPPSLRRSLIARIGAELRQGRVAGYVLTFDDITELQSAQRKAAWADVARRIAHEIKNPLTPDPALGRAAEAKYLKEIGSRPGHLPHADRHHRPPGGRHRPHGGRVLRLRPACRSR
jgi:two-component system nitrogen regulation sensor histidine kinase NtrY